MVTRRIGMPICVLASRDSMEVEDCVDSMRGTELDYMVKVFETFFVQVEGI